jgi:hypothetical protein
MSSVQKSSVRRSIWFERAVAAIALANLGWVLFDLSYVPWRNFYFRQLNPLTQQYDKIKGIEPHRETQKYIDTVEQLKSQIIQTGLQSREVASLLQTLQGYSVEMIESNPFAAANKTGTLEKIKNRMRDRVPTPEKSAKQAFNIFWSQKYLQEKGWTEEIAFYNQSIKPLLAINYFRQAGENDDFINDFWKFDLAFNLFFALEFIARTYSIHRRHAGLKWQEAMLWRWYDIFLILPFGLLNLPLLSLLRIIPVTLRLSQAELINLELLQAQATKGFVASFAEELTQVVVLQAINQLQNTIRQGEITRWLTQQQESKEYVDLNNVNEVEAIAKLAINMTVYQVLPKIQSDIEAILRHQLDRILKQIPGYQGLQNIPGLNPMIGEFTEKLVTELTKSAYSALTATLEYQDPAGDELNNLLIKNLTAAIGEQIQEKQTLKKLQSLLTDLLEEVKVNYVKRLSKEDLEEIIEQSRKIRQLPQS